MYFHGNAGNIGTRLPYFKAMFDQLKVNILAVEYRGYGECGVSLSSMCCDCCLLKLIEFILIGVEYRH